MTKFETFEKKQNQIKCYFVNIHLMLCILSLNTINLINNVIIVAVLMKIRNLSSYNGISKFTNYEYPSSKNFEELNLFKGNFKLHYFQIKTEILSSRSHNVLSEVECLYPA